MAIGLGISGIGYPSMGLGTIGLGAAGSYGNYDNYMPSMMGMKDPMLGMGGYNSLMNPGAMTGMGMMNGYMGMYNPLYYTQIQNAAEQIQLQHAGNMHNQLMVNEVAAHRESDSALISKMLTNSDIKAGIRNLHEKVVEGDQDGICEEFDKLKNYIFSMYRDELNSRGKKINPDTTATDIIENIYSRYVSAVNGGQPANLRQDIERYGDSSAMNGFMNGFRSGNHQKYIDETKNHCFGTPIDQKGSKDKRKEVASFVGRGASVIEKSVYGFGAGAVGYGVWRGLKAAVCNTFNINTKPGSTGFFKNLGKWAWIGAAAGAVTDILWQISDSSSKTA